MESLYRKYRPQTFDDVVGQGHVVETLEHAVLEGRTSHAYLFCGPRGTGKTTMARLLAKALLCEQGPGHLPDGTCEQCQLIAEGEHPDVYELDAASRTGVDNVREEIISRVNYAPARGRYKVYIIDEVHMLTTAAFNALLKTLEEPPSHVVFVLCTTDPQKIPATILSRVQRFDFHAIGSDDMRARLAYVCEQEGFTYDEAALDLIVRHARGGMRDALSTLEQLSVFGDGEVSLDAAQDLLGEVPGSSLLAVSQALANRDVAALFDEVAKLVDAGRDLLQFTRELASHMRDVYVVAAVGARPGVVQASGEALEQLGTEAAAFGSSDRVARILSILGEASGEMRTATNQRLVLEIALTRMARPKADVTLESLAERVDELERQVAALSVPGARPPAVAPAPRVTRDAPTPAAQRPAPGPPRPERAYREDGQPTAQNAQRQPQRQAPARRPVAATAAPVQASRQAEAAVSPAPSGPAVADEGQLQRMWKKVVDTLVSTAASRGSLLMNSTIVSDDGSTLQVSLPKGSGFALRMLERGDVRSTVDPVVAQVFGPRRVVFGEAAPAESGAVRAAHKAQRQATKGRREDNRHKASPAAERGTGEVSTGQPSAQAPAAAPQQHMPQQSPSQPQVPSRQPQPAYEMPWDQPAPRKRQAEAYPQQEAPYEPVPYDDASATSFDETVAESAPVATPAPPARQPSTASRQDQGTAKAVAATGGSPEATAGERQGVPAAGAPNASRPVPRQEATSPAQDAAPADTTSTSQEEGSRKVPDDIPPDLIAIVESAFDVFGDGVKVSKA